MTMGSLARALKDVDQSSEQQNTDRRVNHLCAGGLSDRAAIDCSGGDCYAYGLLASGTVDAVVEAGLDPYDFLALVPVVEAAGGVITDWSGQPLRASSDGRVLAAASTALHEELLETIRRPLRRK